ncbi:MAG: PAS domain S-box protein [Candidatus Lokiarchaeota archaeon]|nr:PAS domain S-box protein [Candidatus Lokiarchaeota archaeon]MBD3340100.1 PAS domain S-box protein [Candidatus Lokiarchaeota archaeon]
MDIYNDGFFVHLFKNFTSINLLFKIRSEYSRNQKERLMISALFENDKKVNFDLSQDLLKNFADELKKVNDAYKAFYLKSQVFEGSKEKFEEINRLFDSFFKSFSIEHITIEHTEAKILFFGLSLAGKTTIIKSRRKSLYKNILPTINVDISRILVNNVSLLTTDTPGQLKFMDLWVPYLKGQDALVFVLDIHDRIKFPDARDLLHKIAFLPEMRDLPLLILFNKVDQGKPAVEELVNVLKLDRFNDRPFKYFFTSGIRRKNIDEAFNWLALKLSEKISPKPKSDVGLIFARWDENIGLKIIGATPKRNFKDIQSVAVQCFSKAQILFNDKKYNKSSIILPMISLKAKLAIYVDYMKRDTLLEEPIPVALMLLYKDKIPIALIEQFNLFILKKLKTLKTYYLNGKSVEEDLQQIVDIITSKLRELKYTFQYLNSTELQYRTLFKFAQEAIIIIDTDSGLILDANPQAEKLLTRSIEDIIGLDLTQLKIKNKDGNLSEIIANDNLNGETIETVLKHSKCKEIPLEISASKVQIGNRMMTMLIIRNVTQRKKMELFLKRRLELEKLISKISSRFLVINKEGFDKLIRQTLIDIGLEFKAKRINVYFFCNKKDFVNLKYSWSQNGQIYHQIDKEMKTELITLEIEEITKGKIIFQSSESAIDAHDVFKSEEGLTTRLLFPIKINEIVRGFICIDNVSIPEEQNNYLLLMLKTCLEFISNAFDKFFFQKTLQENKEEFHQELDRISYYNELFTTDMKKLWKLLGSFVNSNFNSVENYEMKRNKKMLLNAVNKQIECAKDLIKIEKKLTNLTVRNISNEKLPIAELIQKAKEDYNSIYPYINMQIEIIDQSQNEYQFSKSLRLVFRNLFFILLNFENKELKKIKIEITKIRKNDKPGLQIILEKADQNRKEWEREEKDLESHFIIEFGNIGILLRLALVERILELCAGQLYLEDGRYKIYLVV